MKRVLILVLILSLFDQYNQKLILKSKSKISPNSLKGDPNAESFCYLELINLINY